MSTEESQFIGVYSTSEMPVVLGTSLRPVIKRKRMWFVWQLPEELFQVQMLNAIMQPMSEAAVIGLDEFETRFTREPGQTAVPREESGAIGQNGAAFSPFIDANDPDLLHSWLMKPVPAPSPETKDDLSPIQEVHLARLVDESLQAPLPEIHDGALPVFPPPAETPPPAPLDSEQILRGDFTLALLKIKQGKREEGLAILDSLVSWRGAPFDGAAELFSEFGLNLRRLGITNLALLAHHRALELAPQDERVYFNLARVYHDLKQYDTAKEYLENALAIAPDFTTARQFLAFLFGSASADAAGTE